MKARHQITLRWMSVFFGLSAALFVVFSSIPENSILNIFERKVYDGWMVLRGNLPERDDILILGINTADLELIGKWPWSGRDQAEIINVLNSHDPAAIVYDVLFAEREGSHDLLSGTLNQYSEQEINSDATLSDLAATVRYHQQNEKMFVEAVRRAGNVYLAGVLSFSDDQPAGVETELQKKLQKVPVIGNTPAAGQEMPSIIQNLPQATDYDLPFSGLLDACAGAGFINADPDSDGVTRQTQLLARIGDQVLPSLDVVVLCDYLNINMRDVLFTGEDTLVLPAGAGNYQVPLSEEGQMYINYKGPESYIRRGISVSGLLRAHYAGDAGFPASIVKDKIVLIGMVAEGSTDIRGVPVQSHYPMVGVHAQVLDNILSQAPIIVPPDWLRITALIATGLGLGLLLPLLRPFWAAAATLALLAGTIAVAFLLFNYASYWVPAVQPALTIGLGFSAIISYYFFTERRQRSHIQEVFGRCVDKTVVEQIADSGIDPQLGGDRRAITVMFSDIRGFTPYTENHSAEEVVATLNDYFTAMSDVIFANGGTIDKYMGDAIMVFFGEPVPMKDHALTAIRTALQMQEAMKKLHKRWGAEDFTQGIGINTGEVIVGWMGSPSKKEYTIIGDVVNTAFRLQGIAGANQVLIAPSTYEALKDKIEVKELTPVRLKGKKHPLPVYELAGLKQKPEKEKRLNKKDKSIYR